MGKQRIYCDWWGLFACLILGAQEPLRRIHRDWMGCRQVRDRGNLKRTEHNQHWGMLEYARGAAWNTIMRHPGGREINEVAGMRALTKHSSRFTQIVVGYPQRMWVRDKGEILVDLRLPIRSTIDNWQPITDNNFRSWTVSFVNSMPELPTARILR